MESFGSQRCRTLCWVAAGLLGLFVIYLMRHYWDVPFMWSLLVGLIAFFVLAWLIPLFACPMDDIDLPVRRMPAPVHVQPKPAAEPAPAPEAAAVAAPAAAAAVSEKAETAKATVKKASTSGATTAAKKAAKPAPKAAKAKAAAQPAPAPVAAPTAKKSSKPAGLDAARDGKPDDLKIIVGVGPAMEKLLNKLGYFHFDQIAAWKAAEVAWVDDNLEGFKGRVTRDKWVEQAKKLAKG